MMFVTCIESWKWLYKRHQEDPSQQVVAVRLCKHLIRWGTILGHYMELTGILFSLEHYLSL